MKLSTILTTLYLIQNQVTGKEDDKKFCKSSRWLQETVDKARNDDIECKVQNSRIFGICGLILGDLFRFKSEKQVFIKDKLPGGRYAKYSMRDRKSIDQYMDVKMNHLTTMHDYYRCGEIREHMENYYPQLFLVHAYTLSDLSIKGNILPFVDYGLNKVVKDEENLNKEEQDELDMYLNVPINIHNRITEIFLSIKGEYAQHVRYRRDTNAGTDSRNSKSDLQLQQERTLAKMFEMVTRVSNAKNSMNDIKSDIQDMVEQNNVKMAEYKDDIIKRVIGKLDSNSRNHKYELENMLGEMKIPKFGSQATLITIVSIQLIVIIALIIIINKNNNQLREIQTC